jgi:uncharacterized protein with HEPN domain
MRNDDRIRILHMIDAAESVEQFAAGKKRGDLDTDRMLSESALDRQGRFSHFSSG